MNKKIIQIGDLFDENVVDSTSYCSDDYFLDADIIILDLAKVMEEFWKLSTGFNAVILPESREQAFQQHVLKRTNQLTKYLENVCLQTKLDT